MDDLWSVDRFLGWMHANGRNATRDHVTRMCRDGTLPAVRIGRFWFVDTNEILKEVRNGTGKSDAA